MDDQLKLKRYFSRAHISKSQIILLLFPIWIMLYYFKDLLSGWLVYKVLSLPQGTLFSKSLAFFILTTTKIFLLLALIIFLMAVIRTWLPVEKIRKKLLSMSSITANTAASLFGVVSPFCSCSAIPMFISFLESGIPLGITFSFLIASPLVNEIILAMLFSLFGWKTALIYMAAGLVIAIISGYFIDRLNLERFLPEWIMELRSGKRPQNTYNTIDDRISAGFRSVRKIISGTWIYIIIGILAGSLIHGYLPENLITRLLSGESWYTMPLVVVTGIPLYACSAAIAPVAFALVDKGASLGIALAFMMAVAGLSLPEFIMLKKVLSLRLTLIFAGIVFTGILIVGYFFSWIL